MRRITPTTFPGLSPTGQTFLLFPQFLWTPTRQKGRLFCCTCWLSVVFSGEVQNLVSASNPVIVVQRWLKNPSLNITAIYPRISKPEAKQILRDRRMIRTALDRTKAGEKLVKIWSRNTQKYPSFSSFFPMYPENENIVHDIKIFSFYVSQCIPFYPLSVDSGSSGRTPVGVRVPASAPVKKEGRNLHKVTAFVFGLTAHCCVSRPLTASRLLSSREDLQTSRIR
jgi:hypothetical protein